MRDVIKIAEEIIESDSLGEIVLAVVEEASRRFHDAGAGGDFCLQHIGGTCIIFGSTNRVRWTPRHGFVPERGYCTQQFLSRWGE